MTSSDEKPRRRRGKKGKNVNTNSLGTKPKNEESDNDVQKSQLQFIPHSSLLLVLDEEHPHWYTLGKKFPDGNTTIYSPHATKTKPANPPSTAIVNQYRNLADQIYSHEISLYQNYYSHKDEQWVQNTMKRGTLKDRVAAMSVTSSQAPIHKLHSGLDALLKLATQAKTASQQQRVNQLAGEALVDLFLNTYLPPDRKLYGMNARPLMEYYENPTKTLSPRILVLWRMEELIKEKYRAFVNLLMQWCSTDTSSNNAKSSNQTLLMNNMTGSSNELQKIMALKTCAHLLSQRPENEGILLQTIVNKMGDPHKKTAAAAGHALRNILDQHPVMIHVISREVMQLAHRPKLSEKAMYHCIIFLNQLQLKHTPDHNKLASELVSTYFRFFQMTVQYNHDNEDEKSTSKKNHPNNHNGMKSRLLSALLTGVNRAHPFLPVQDSLQDQERINALYKIAHYTSSPGTSTQALMLLNHLVIGVPSDPSSTVSSSPSPSSQNSSSEKQNRFYKTLYSTLSSPTMLCQGGTKHHLTLYFNLLYKSMKRDTHSHRVVAFAKRLLHTVCHAMENPCGVMTASLFLLSEVSRHQPVLKSFINSAALSSSEQEKTYEYDTNKRDPRMAFGDASGHNNTSTTNLPKLWEVYLYQHHFHPSVQKFAVTYLDEKRGNVIDYGGDPLRDFALMPFLDRFAYRHPKARDRTKQSSDKESKNIFEKTVSQKSKHINVNDEQFWNHPKTRISVDNEFFLKFFKERARRDAVKGIVRGSEKKSPGDDDDAALDQVIAKNEERAEGADDAVLQKLEEDGWDTDPEEEAFANELAEKLMENSGTGKANLDKEDPDMEGWDDMYSTDDSDNDNDDPEEKETNVDFSKMDGIQRIDEDVKDEFDHHFSNVEEDEDSDGVDDEDAFMDADESESDEDKELKRDDDEDDGEEDNEFVSMMTQEEGDSDEENKIKNNSSTKAKSKKQKLSSAFEDADDYAEVIAKAWADRDQLKFKGALDDTADGFDTEKEKKRTSKNQSYSADFMDTPKNNGKGKKRKKSRKK